MGVQRLILPDFLVIGANKAGTSTIYQHLSGHEQVSMCRTKEPMFFSSPPNRPSAALDDMSLDRPFFATTLRAYSDLFHPGHAPGLRDSVVARFFRPIRDRKKVLLYGECSTAYLAHPRGTASLIKKIVPDVKLIAVLREPAERAFSAYRMFASEGLDTRPFSSVIDETAGTMSIDDPLPEGHPYIRDGLYAQQLSMYYKFFNRDQILVLDYEDFKANNQQTMDRITDFLSIDRMRIDPDIRLNTAQQYSGNSISPSHEDMHRLRLLYAKEVARLRDMFPGMFTGWDRTADA